MTDDLKPCPFCGGGITTIEGGGQIWRGVNGYSDPQFYHLRHFGKLSETDDFPRCFVEFRCRTEAEAIAAWNARAPDPRIEALTAERDEHWKSFVHWRKEADALTEQLEAARADAKEAEAYADELAGDQVDLCSQLIAAEDKLAQAMTHVMDYSNDPHLVQFARATLAEIEGEKE
jgi:hypothetical protein